MRARLAIVGLLVATAMATAALAQEWGRFNGLPQVELMGGEGRRVRLLRDFVYTDPKGVVWRTPRGWVVDGASIPRVLWGVAGGPLDGPYRDASIIHDYYCDKQNRPWLEVHRAFYFGMRANGVPAAEARDKYLAVFKFGPRWGEPPNLGDRIMDVLFGWAEPPRQYALMEELTLRPEAMERWDSFADQLAEQDLPLEELEAAAEGFQFRRSDYENEREAWLRQSREIPVPVPPAPQN